MGIASITLGNLCNGQKSKTLQRSRRGWLDSRNLLDQT